jgi:hypothetical protein
LKTNSVVNSNSSTKKKQNTPSDCLSYLKKNKLFIYNDEYLEIRLYFDRFDEEGIWMITHKNRGMYDGEEPYCNFKYYKISNNTIKIVIRCEGEAKYGLDRESGTITLGREFLGAYQDVLTINPNNGTLKGKKMVFYHK